MATRPKVVIVGGGFAGLFAAQNLKRADVDITLIDKRNFHLFQPLLYQVATGGLSPGDIAVPLRSVLRKQKNATVLKATVRDIDPKEQTVFLDEGSISYDILILATGVRHAYFGNDHWAEDAPGLKTVENALNIRQKVLSAFERAERTDDPKEREACQRFVIVGAGPTGVELAGALGELAHATMRRDFRRIDPHDTEIHLLEGATRVLPPYPEKLSAKAKASLEKLGVTVHTGTLVTNIDGQKITMEQDGKKSEVLAETVLWAAGVRASKLGRVLEERTGVERDRAGRVKVGPDLTIPGFSNLFVIGDLSHAVDDQGKPLPGVASVAMQQGRYVAQLIRKQKEPNQRPGFRYFDKGSLAVIGRNAAVADVGLFKLSGLPAWMIWAFVHIHYLIEFGNKFAVSFQWFWNYLTRKRGARLITESVRNDDPDF